MPAAMIPRPIPGTYNDYLGKYFQLVNGDNPLLVLKEQVLDFKALLSEIPIELEDYRYAEGKWSVKELVGHIIDTERIFAYRALCMRRTIMQPPDSSINEPCTTSATSMAQCAKQPSRCFGICCQKIW
jgi:hypothetical protein